MKTHDLTFATRPRSATIDVVSGGGKGIVLAPYGEHWRQMRKICMVELLSAKQVKRMESIRSQEVANLLRSVAASASSSSIVNLSNLVAVLSNDITGRAVFGGMCAQQSEYLREMGEIVKLVGGFCPADLYPSSRLVRWLSSGERNLRKSYGGIQRIIDNIIDGRKAERESDVACSSSTDDEDLLGVLLRLKEEDSLAFPLTSETIGTVIFDIFGAGSESSATTLGWAMLELMKNPEAMVKAQTEVRKVLGQGRVVITNVDLGELHFLHMIIKEVLRLHPPAPLLVPRETDDAGAGVGEAEGEAAAVAPSLSLSGGSAGSERVACPVCREFTPGSDYCINTHLGSDCGQMLGYVPQLAKVLAPLLDTHFIQCEVIPYHIAKEV
ncbi:Cytochrome P450 71D7 [Hordeum vulgare]|nr:Cytochrome P450 71D7 [Hordeum vulgare]